MKWVVVALALIASISADKLEGGVHHEHHHHADHDSHELHANHEQHAAHEHHEHHAEHQVKQSDVISPATSLSQPIALPVHATPVQTFSQAHASPAQSFHQQPLAPAQTYSQPSAPAAPAPGGSFSQYPEEQSYYYYYYPEVPKEKDLWTKIQDKFTSLFFSTSRSDIAGYDSTTTFVIIAIVSVLLIVLGPSIAGLLGLTGVMAKMSVLIEKLVSATTGGARDLDVNMDDVMFYATKVYEAINTKY